MMTKGKCIGAVYNCILTILRWLSHELHFVKDSANVYEPSIDQYVTLDPRVCNLNIIYYSNL
jgi:hypothetical protein